VPDSGAAWSARIVLAVGATLDSYLVLRFAARAIRHTLEATVADHKLAITGRAARRRRRGILVFFVVVGVVVHGSVVVIPCESEW